MTALLHGKLPAHGDFVSRGLTPSARDALDLWLSESLARARAMSGDRFEAVWDEAPPWRFAWHDGARWTAGALAASLDAAGRRYPLFLARGDLADVEVEDVAARMEGLLYDALAGGSDADRLHAAALLVAPAPGDAWQGGEGWWTVDAERLIAARLDGARPSGLLTAMLTMGRQDA